MCLVPTQMKTMILKKDAHQKTHLIVLPLRQASVAGPQFAAADEWPSPAALRE